MGVVRFPNHRHINSSLYPSWFLTSFLPSTAVLEIEEEIEGNELSLRGLPLDRACRGCRHLLCYLCPFFHLRHKMGEWVPSLVMEAKLQHLMAKGLLTSKEVIGWSALTSEVVPHQ